MRTVTEDISAYYQKLFTLGSLSRNIILYITFYLIYYILVYFFLYFSLLTHVNYIILSLAIPLISLTIEYILLRGGRDKRLFTLRRLLAINIIYLIIIIILFLIFLPLLFFNPNIWILMFIFSVGLTYKTIIFTSTSDQKPYGIIAITSLPLLIYIFIIFLIDYKPLFIDITSLIIVFEPILYAYLVSAVFLYLISSTSKKIIPYSSIFDFLKGFIDSWVLDEPDRLETLLSDNSIDITVDTYLLALPDTKWRPTYLIIPYFHFGPFRNIGSSRFPSILSEYLYLRKGVNSMIFHTPTSHDLDLSSYKETKQIIEQITELSEPIICTGISNIHTVQVDDVRVYTIKLDNNIIIILESSEMEDLPLELAKKIVEYGKRLGYKEVIVIDAHNSLKSIKYRIPEKTLANMLSASRRALRESLDQNIYSFKAGFIKFNIPTFTRKKGLGEAGISILIWETLTELNTIINIDSNNLSTQLREDIIKLIKNKFNSRVVVTTTDTHEVTAIPLNERGYILLGEKDRGKKLILTSIFKAMRKVLDELKETDIIIYHKKIKTKVLGMDTIEKMGLMLNKAYNMMTKGLLYILIPSFILHISLIYILGYNLII